MGDEAEALRCYQDAHRMFPANMDVISWLGAFHVKNEASRFPSLPQKLLVQLSARCSKCAAAGPLHLLVH